MPNGLPDPLSAVRQVGEQTAQSLTTLMNSASQAASQGLSALSSPLKSLQLPQLPGMKGAAAPPNLIQPLIAPLEVVKGVEEVALPKGIPRPAASLLNTVKQAAQGPTTNRGEVQPSGETRQPTIPRGGRGSL